jgi:hypothetical protein
MYIKQSPHNLPISFENTCTICTKNYNQPYVTKPKKQQQLQRQDINTIDNNTEELPQKYEDNENIDTVTDTAEPLLNDDSTEKEVLDDKKEAVTTTDDNNGAKSQFQAGTAPIIDDVIQETLIVDNFIGNTS